MQTKIYWLIDNIIERFGATAADQDLVFSGMLEVAKKVAQPSTKFVLNEMTRNMGRYAIATQKYDRAMMSVEVLERMKQAEADGFDAGFPGICYGEFFLHEARQAVTMPVVGPAESAMVNNVIRQANRKPAVMPQVMGFLLRYEQVRHLLDLADAETAAAA